MVEYLGKVYTVQHTFKWTFQESTLNSQHIHFLKYNSWIISFL